MRKAERTEESLLEMLEEKGKTRLKIERELKELSKEFQVILVEKSFDKKNIRNQLNRYLIRKGFHGVYVTLNNPVDTLIKDFKEEGIDLKKIFFVDCVSRGTGEKFKKQRNALYLDDLKNLIELKLLIQEAIKKIKNKKRFLVIDSLTTLLVYNREKAVEKFIYSVIERDRLKNVQTALLTTPSTDKRAMDNISQFCDKIIVI